jgi:pimeloyl-ACP methyl ester carboxylesterase
LVAGGNQVGIEGQTKLSEGSRGVADLVDAIIEEGSGHIATAVFEGLNLTTNQGQRVADSRVETAKIRSLEVRVARDGLHVVINIGRGIDLDAYNSKAIAQDLNALKTVLKYQKWNVYGASYGTYIAQVYANNYPNDIKSLLLDSSISDITKYYNNNSTNYMSSLKKVFSACENDPNCNKTFPNLEKVYFETIDKLNKAPITVKVDKKIIANGQFTYNSEDFKVAIQQGLYNKKLIEVMPLLIYEFNRGNKATLSSLVAAFSGSLSLDYGQYYCVSCNEVIPNNSLDSFNNDAQQYKKLKGGLSFYKSDFLVCDKWNLGMNKKKVVHDLSKLSSLQSPVIVFSGEFDPITPVSNGINLSKKIKKSYLINAPVYGHVSSFSKYGFKIVNDLEKFFP